MSLLLGTARADITPLRPVPLAGFEFRSGQPPAPTVARALKLRVLAFGEVPHRLAAVFISADLIWWGSPLAEVLRRAISRRYAIPASAILLHATHGHSGPQTAHGFTASLGVPEQHYLDRLSDLTLGAVADAASAMRPVTVERTYGACLVGVNRRGELHAGSGLRADPGGPVDPEVTVLRFRDSGGATRALLVHFACHPVIAWANEVSSDFTGAAMDALEADLPAGSVAVYAQGCCGDVNPAVLDGDHFRSGDETEVAAYGARLATAVRAALTGAATRLGPPHLASMETSVPLPLCPPPDRRTLQTVRDEPGVVGQWARLLLAAPERLRATTELRLTGLRVTEDLVLLGFGAEPTTAYGRYVKATYRGRVLPLGYTNGMFGYLVTDDEAAAGGYEAVAAPRYFGMPAPLAPGAERHARNAVDRLVTRWLPAGVTTERGAD